MTNRFYIALTGFILSGWVCSYALSQSVKFSTLNTGTPSTGTSLRESHTPPGNKNSPRRSQLSPYHFDVWTTDNGLPQNSINSILQSRDGYLWFTTYDGLVRYDGVQFTVFNAGNTPELKSSRFSHLFEDRDGYLWVNTEANQLIRYKDGEFVTFSKEDGLTGTLILQIRQDEGSPLLVHSESDVVYLKDGRFFAQDPSSPRLYNDFGYPVRSGAVWHLDETGLHRLEQGRVTAHAWISGLTSRDIKVVFEDRQGVLWVGASRGLLLRFKDGAFNYYSQKDGLPDNRINVLCDDRQGNLWIGTSNGGVYRFKDNQFTSYTTTNGLAGNEILSLYEDREGILWIGSTGGLSRLRDNIITSYAVEDGLTANNTYPICLDNEGTIWIGTWPGLTKYQAGIFTRCGEQYGVAKELVTSLMRDKEGSMWIGCWGGGARRYQDGVVTAYMMKDGLPDNVVRAIRQDKQGTIWIGTQNGLAKYQQGAFTIYTTKDGLPGNTINVIYEDRDGHLWIGTQSGVCQLKDGQFSSYAGIDGLSGHIIRAIYEDRDGVFWFGTYDAGLVRYKDGNFTRITVKEGLFNNGVFQILEDAKSNFWMSCNLGIYRVNKGELNDYAEGRGKTVTAIPYGKRDGMLNSECNGGGQPAGVAALDGKLWFPTQGGVAVVDPEAVPISAQPPSVMIEKFLVDNRATSFRQFVEIPADTENFEIHYTGLSFIMSERLKFKYQLEGWDTDWVDADTRRVAYYTHVTPGRYTFRVIAANRDGVWNLQGASVQLHLVPPFWKTGWFYSLVLVSAAGLIWLSIWLRIKRLEKARLAQEAFSQQLIKSQESERQRIAAELHDSLGQHLLIIKNSALLGLHLSQPEARGREQLDDISATASQAIEEVREISYNLRPYQLDDLGLSKAIESIIAKVAASCEIEIISQIPSLDGRFLPEAEINLYRIIQECLNNIVKHSAATQAKIIIETNGQLIELFIQDNGRGFNIEKKLGQEREGFGLQGIAERARMLGAKLDIQSTVGQGTTVTLGIEANNRRYGK
ncbi:MAG: two-component regulator propeller domain-containing protein [Acidobacteriota bacterium]